MEKAEIEIYYYYYSSVIRWTEQFISTRCIWLCSALFLPVKSVFLGENDFHFLNSSKTRHDL